MPSLIVETIRYHLDEQPCQCCGQPLYVGDRAFFDLARGVAYCTRSCAAADQVSRPIPRPLDSAA
jgi:hypothetical protein